jgi:zinc transporter 2
MKVERIYLSKRNYNFSQTIRCDLDHDHSIDHCDKTIDGLELNQLNDHKCHHDHTHHHKHSYEQTSNHFLDHTYDHTYSHRPSNQSSPDRLMENVHDHSHHGHSHEGIILFKIENVNIRAAMIHIIGDVVQSVGVVIASLVIYFNDNLTWVDPLCTFVFSIIVMMTTYNITKQCILILMEATNQPTELICNQLVSKFTFLKSVHNLHIWELSSGKKCISFHAISTQENQLSNITLFLKKDYKEVTVQIETEDDYVLCNNK